MGSSAPVSAPSTPSGDGVDRFRLLVWWSTVAVVYAVGVFMVVSLLLSGLPAVLGVGGAAGAAIGAWASARLLGRRLGGESALNPGESFSPPSGLVVASATGALAVVVAATAGGGMPTWAIVPGVALGAIGVWVPRRRRLWAVATSTLVALGVAVGLRYVATGAVVLAQDMTDAVIVGLIALALISTMWSWDVVLALDRARRLEARLAVADERLRFAADLHDVQGHHLQVIALESELATRLAGSDPEAARAHMQEVQAQARSALGETRNLVRGYRRTSLGAELGNATRVLAAAEIDGRLERGTEEAADRVPEEGRQLLGLVVREATTNILRHSHADRARIGLRVDDGSAHLQMGNDGVTASADPPGTGLSTLAERIREVGGDLDWGRDGEWFRLHARVPVEVGR